MLNTYLKHVTYNLFLGCSFTDMTRRFVDYMCVVFCCKLVRCSYLYVVLFSMWGCILRCPVVVVAIFCVSINVFRSNDVCYVFFEFVDVMRFLMSCVFICCCF